VPIVKKAGKILVTLFLIFVVIGPVTSLLIYLAKLAIQSKSNSKRKQANAM